MRKTNLTIVNGCLASYPHGGGHWSAFMQYVLGLLDLNQNLFWLEILNSSGNPETDKRLIDVFFRRFIKYGMGGRSAILLNMRENSPTLDNGKVFGLNKTRVQRFINDTEILWNFCCTIRNPLLGLFRNSLKAVIDLDPGILQISDIEWNLGINDHDVFFTVGSKINDTDCKVPTLGKKWHTFYPPIFLPIWNVTDNQELGAPFTSITQWTWGEYWYMDEVLSLSKRDAYLKYLATPIICQYPFELAANIHPRDRTGDREKLKLNGWKLIHPHIVTKTIQSYQRYIQYSRGEFSCAKPIYAQLRTGWFSDRSAAFLASGRPVIAEDTGFGDYIPVGRGLIRFDCMDEVKEAVERVNKDYVNHKKAARQIANEFLDSRLILTKILDLCN